MNYIIWNNKESKDIKGLIICELPPITKPKMRVKETVIDGVDGSIIEELGYESYNKSISIGLKTNADIDEVIEYFTGNGEVIFSNEPNKYYKARIINSIDYARLLRFRKATVTFRVQPFKYDLLEIERQANSERNSMIIENIGNYTSKPLITITGSGEVTLKVNGSTICTYTFDNNDTVILDSEKQDAYLGNVLKNRNMIGEFPIFQKGNNTLLCDGNVSSIKVKNYSRWV